MKIGKIFIGPEFFWLVMYLIGYWVSKTNTKPDYAFDSLIENVWIYVPVLALLTLGFFWIPGTEKNWLLTRLWVAAIIMGHLLLDMLIKSYSKQGPGIGMSYIAGLIFMLIALFIGSIAVKFLKP